LGAAPSIIDNSIAVTQDEILDHFRATNALLDGHFVLSSGLHSPTYLQCALALQRPADADRFARELVNRMALDRSIEGVETVASPAIGGLVIGFAVAQAIGVRFIWTERQNGEMTLRRGFSLRKGEKVLVVEDVITTGGSTRECMAALSRCGAEIIAAASIVDRSGGKADVGVPRTSLITLEVPTYEPSHCPLCLSGSTPAKPGSRSEPAACAGGQSMYLGMFGGSERALRFARIS
jgi:orotate phosphoribosyltransferase